MADLRGAQRFVRQHWLFAATAAILFAAPRSVVGQARVTTKTGVYSLPQASRGQDVYVGYCKSCHTPESHAGPVFNATWNGKKLSELFAYIRERMPKNEPASLSDEEYADVLAYLLKLNRMPNGKSELPSDSAKLGRIRFETNTPIKITKSSRGSSP
jgi:mono/diheme cytochrome c family protein